MASGGATGHTGGTDKWSNWRKFIDQSKVNPPTTNVTFRQSLMTEERCQDNDTYTPSSQLQFVDPQLVGEEFSAVTVQENTPSYQSMLAHRSPVYCASSPSSPFPLTPEPYRTDDEDDFIPQDSSEVAHDADLSEATPQPTSLCDRSPDDVQVDQGTSAEPSSQQVFPDSVKLEECEFKHSQDEEAKHATELDATCHLPVKIKDYAQLKLKRQLKRQRQRLARQTARANGEFCALPNRGVARRLRDERLKQVPFDSVGRSSALHDSYSLVPCPMPTSLHSLTQPILPGASDQYATQEPGIPDKVFTTDRRYVNHQDLLNLTPPQRMFLIEYPTHLTRWELLDVNLNQAPILNICERLIAYMQQQHIPANQAPLLIDRIKMCLRFRVHESVRWRCLRNVPRILPILPTELLRCRVPLRGPQQFHGFIESTQTDSDGTVYYDYVPRPEIMTYHGVSMISHAWDQSWQEDDLHQAAHHDAMAAVARQWPDTSQLSANTIPGLIQCPVGMVQSGGLSTMSAALPSIQKMTESSEQLPEQQAATAATATSQAMEHQ